MVQCKRCRKWSSEIVQPVGLLVRERLVRSATGDETKRSTLKVPVGEAACPPCLIEQGYRAPFRYSLSLVPAELAGPSSSPPPVPPPVEWRGPG